MTRQMLRERVEGHHARVTTVELFFDLVFVFAVTQLSHTLLEQHGLAGVLETLLLLLAVWWAWIYTTWVTNWLDPDNPVVRSALFVLMALGLLLSTSIPEAFGERALIFALAFTATQVGRTLFMVWAVRSDDSLRRNFVRMAIWKSLSAVFWLSGALAGGWQPAFWSAALAIEYASAALGFWTPGMGRTSTDEWTVEGAHMAERCGLFIIICLGESILMTGATFAGGHWTPADAAAFLIALLGSVAMWWIYFNAAAEAASEAIANSRDPGAIARLAYTYAHIPIVAGIIVAAAGDELALAHPLGEPEPQAAWLILGGPALFLAGGLWFKHAVFRVISPSRATGLALLGAAAVAAPHLTPIALLGATTTALGLTAAWETFARRSPGPTAEGARG